MRKVAVCKLAAAVAVVAIFASCASSGSRGAGSSPPAADAEALDAAETSMGGVTQAGRGSTGFEALHMELTPRRATLAGDSVRAMTLVRELRTAIARYRDTSAAAADGYRIFLPQLKGQRIYHFTSRRRAMGEAFRWDPARPTSLLYSRDAAGRFTLVGAMYTMPARASLGALDARVPLSVAQWHRHVNWCLPPRGENQRWRERRDGAPLFGPQSPIATQAACDAVRGRFHERVFGWMVHANVFAGDDLATIFGDGHHGGAAGHQGHAGHGGHEGH